MRKRLTILMPVLAGLFILAISVPSEAQFLRRLTADFMNFDGTETATTAPASADPAVADGVTVFRKAVFVPAGNNVLYFTISTTHDTHNGAALWLSARVDGVPFNPGFGGAAGAPPGWIALGKHKNYGLGFVGDGGGGDGDVHDNGTYYTWCTAKFRPGAVNTIELKMASSGIDVESPDAFTPPTVFFEAAHFYVDANTIFSPNRCTEVPREPSPGVAAVSNTR